MHVTFENHSAKANKKKPKRTTNPGYYSEYFLMTKNCIFQCRKYYRLCWRLGILVARRILYICVYQSHRITSTWIITISHCVSFIELMYDVCVSLCISLSCRSRIKRSHTRTAKMSRPEKKNENMKGTNRMAGGACETKSLMSFKLCIVFTSSFFFLYVSIRCFVFPTMTWFCCFFFDLFANSGHIQERRSRRTDGRTGKYVSKQSKNKKQTNQKHKLNFFLYLFCFLYSVNKITPFSFAVCWVLNICYSVMSMSSKRKKNSKCIEIIFLIWKSVRFYLSINLIGSFIAASIAYICVEWANFICITLGICENNQFYLRDNLFIENVQ